MIALVILFFAPLLGVFWLRSKIPNPVNLSVWVAVLCSVLVQTFGYISMGYLDSFVAIALIVGWLISFISSLFWFYIINKFIR